MSSNKHNFAPASTRDDFVYGATCPGWAPDREAPKAIKDEHVEEWASFMKSQGVTRVLSLLGDKELAFFENPPEETLAKNGIKVCTRVTLSDPNATEEYRKLFQEAEAAGEKVVVHCAAGQFRTGTVHALYLKDKYNLTLDEAAAEVATQAENAGVKRAALKDKLAALIEGPADGGGGAESHPPHH